MGFARIPALAFAVVWLQGQAPEAKYPEWPRRIEFSGQTWIVKTSGEKTTGPGGNRFSDGKENVWVDDAGRLHLRITRKDGKWLCAEVVSLKSFGYGRYVFRSSSRVDLLDPNVVLGLFTWSDAPAHAHREIDIEFARWGKAGDPTNAQFVVQPFQRPGNLKRYAANLADREKATHAFEWREDKVLFTSFYGHSAEPAKPGDVILAHTYAGKDVPRHGDENVRLNLWLSEPAGPSDGKEAEAVIDEFKFVLPR